MRIQISEHFNYTKLVRFTIPTIVMMIFTSVYGVVDGIFVSNIVGSDSFAAVNLIMPVAMIMGSVGFMIGTGGSALVSKTLGEGKQEKANEDFSLLIYFLIAIGMLLTVLGIIFLRPVAALVGAEGKILEDCVVYGRVLLIALIPFVLQNAFQSFLVVAERPKMGLLISVAAGIANMAFDFVFMYFLRGGIFGAAMATALSQVIGGIIPLVYFIRNNASPLRLVKVKPRIEAILKSCANGSSEMLTNLSMSLVNILYNMQLMKLTGSDGVVAYGIIMYVSFIFSGTYIGYSIGAAPIISYHYGAGNRQELKSLFQKSMVLLLAAAAGMTALAELLSGALAGVFVSYDKGLLAMTAHAIQLYSVSYLLSGFNIFGSACFTALNNGVVSALISFFRTLFFQVVMILLLPLFFGLDGIWLSMAAAEVLALVVTGVCMIKYRKVYHYL